MIYYGIHLLKNLYNISSNDHSLILIALYSNAKSVCKDINKIKYFIIEVLHPINEYNEFKIVSISEDSITCFYYSTIKINFIKLIIIIKI